MVVCEGMLPLRTWCSSCKQFIDKFAFVQHQRHCTYLQHARRLEDESSADDSSSSSSATGPVGPGRAPQEHVGALTSGPVPPAAAGALTSGPQPQEHVDEPIADNDVRAGDGSETAHAPVVVRRVLRRRPPLPADAVGLTLRPQRPQEAAADAAELRWSETAAATGTATGRCGSHTPVPASTSTADELDKLFVHQPTTLLGAQEQDDAFEAWLQRRAAMGEAVHPVKLYGAANWGLMETVIKEGMGRRATGSLVRTLLKSFAGRSRGLTLTSRAMVRSALLNDPLECPCGHTCPVCSLKKLTWEERELTIWNGVEGAKSKEEKVRLLMRDAKAILADMHANPVMFGKHEYKPQSPRDAHGHHVFEGLPTGRLFHERASQAAESGKHIFPVILFYDKTSIMHNGVEFFPAYYADGTLPPELIAQPSNWCGASSPSPRCSSISPLPLSPSLHHANRDCHRPPSPPLTDGLSIPNNRP